MQNLFRNDNKISTREPTRLIFLSPLQNDFSTTLQDPTIFVQLAMQKQLQQSSSLKKGIRIEEKA